MKTTPTGSSIKRRPFLGLLGAGLVLGSRGQANTVGPAIKVSLRDAHKGTLDVDTQLLDSYGRLPDTLRSFYLESRAVFAADKRADFSHPDIVESAAQHGLGLMGGPLLGDLGTDGVTIWVRPALEGNLTVNVQGAGSQSTRGLSVKPGIAHRVRFDGLKPKTRYRYEVLNGASKLAEGGFTTAPLAADRGTFRLAFGSCCHKIGVHNSHLYREIVKREPQAMMLLGDIAVDDREEQVNMHRADYQLRDVSAPWRQLAANVPLYTSWDDHDYFNNDLSGIPRRFTSADRDALRAVWQQNWNNPPADDGREGIYFNTRLGPVELIMLDTRSCRDNARRNERGAYLGGAQMDWFKQTLKSSTAPFKVVSSGTMWSDYVTKAKDSWGTWDIEGREEIYGLIEKEKIGGVLLISGDRHGARGFKIPRPSGFAFHEFEAATLGGVSGPAGLVKDCPEQLFGYDGGDFVAFGEFTFDTAGEEPKVTFRLIDQTGKVREEHPLSLSQMTP